MGNVFIRAVAVGLCGLAFAAAPAAADIEVSGNEGPPGQFVSGDAGTLTFRGLAAMNMSAAYRPATHDYLFTSFTGNFTAVAGSPADLAIPSGCTGVGTTTMTCPEALTGRPGYRLNFLSATSNTMRVVLTGPGNATTTAAFPALAITATGGSAHAQFDNGSGSAVTFTGGSGNDEYDAGTGVEHVTMGGGTDTLDFSGYASNRCVTVTLDDVANDAVNACNSSSTLGALLESGENFGSDIENVVGGDGRDSITGDSLINDIQGGDGFDNLGGGGGADTLHVENDGGKMTGGPGADVFDVPAGEPGVVSYADKSLGVTADFDGVADDGTQCPGGACEGDQVDADATEIEGGSGVDTLTSAASGRTLRGGGAGDTLNGAGGDDVLRGEDGDDTLNGGGLNDTIAPGPGDDTYDGGTGVDTLDYSEATVDLPLSIAGGSGDGEGGLEDVPTTIEDMKGGSGDDELVGDGDANKLFGGRGDDTLDGRAGNDTLLPNQGDVTTGTPVDSGCDVMKGGADSDFFDTGPLNDPDLGCRDVVDYSDHSTGVTVTLANGFVAGQGSSGENDTLNGSRLDVIGTDQADTMSVTTAFGKHTLDGRGGVDNLTGGPEDDTFIGGTGSDALNGGSGGSDTASYSNYSIPVTADLDGVADDGATGTGEADNLSGIENLTGGSAGDHLTGDGNANRLSGAGGGDSLDGLGGGDTLDGGTGANTENGGDGDDHITGGPSGGNTVDAGAGADDVNVRNSAVDSVRCGADADTVVADPADNADGDCESVDRGLPPDPPAGGGGPGTVDPGTVDPGLVDPGSAPGGPAAPGDTLAPRVAIGPRSLRLSRTGVATLTIACPSDETSCTGTVTLASAKKTARPGQSRRKSKVITFGRKTFTAAGGRTTRVKIKLKRSDLALVKRLRRISTRATADVRDAAGNRGTVTAATTLVAPSSKGSRP